MSPDRFHALCNIWIGKGRDACAKGDNSALTVALLAHAMICAAYLRHILSDAGEPDPVKVPLRVKR